MRTKEQIRRCEKKLKGKFEIIDHKGPFKPTGFKGIFQCEECGAFGAFV